MAATPCEAEGEYLSPASWPAPPAPQMVQRDPGHSYDTLLRETCMIQPPTVPWHNCSPPLKQWWKNSALLLLLLLAAVAAALVSLGFGQGPTWTIVRICYDTLKLSLNIKKWQQHIKSDSIHVYTLQKNNARMFPKWMLLYNGCSSLAPSQAKVREMLRFGASKLHFWRKSRRIASFLSFKASILKEVSQKSFVFDLQSFVFEGSFAEKLRFWASKLRFWRKSRRKASFSFVFELQSFIFEGSLAELLRFWASKLQFWRKSRRKASFLKEVSQNSFVWQNHLNHTSVDNQITWTSNHLTSKSLESQINWQPTHLNLKSIDNQITWISDQLTTESLESQINWQPHHLKFKSTDNQNHLKHTSIDNQIIWISNQLTTKSIESQINWQPKSFESQIRWQPNHLTLNSFESDISWLSNQLNSAHSLPIGSLFLETSATALCGRYVILLIVGSPKLPSPSHPLDQHHHRNRTSFQEMMVSVGKQI